MSTHFGQDHTHSGQTQESAQRHNDHDDKSSQSALFNMTSSQYPALFTYAPDPLAEVGGCDNTWDGIRADAQLDPRLHLLEAHNLTERIRRLASMDPTQQDDANATNILEAKVEVELAFQYDQLAQILVVDGRQKDKSYEAILRARSERFTRRLDRYRWDKIFKSTNDIAGSKALIVAIKENEPEISYHRRVMYRSVVQWLERTDDKYQGMEDGWPKCRYVTEVVYEEVCKLTEELWQERVELEKVYWENKGKPPAYYQSNWSGPLMESD